MSTATWLAIRLGYLAGGLVVLLAVGAVLNAVIDRKIRQHLRRATDIPYLPIEAALRRHPSNCRKVERRVTVPRRLG